MIVVDTNVLAYLWIPGERTRAAEALLREDPRWLAPRLWRSEMRNILATSVRTRKVPLRSALALMERVESQMTGAELEVDSAVVLALAERSGCSAYDCEFVALAEELDVPFVTADRKLARAFPSRARALGA